MVLHVNDSLYMEINSLKYNIEMLRKIINDFLKNTDESTTLHELWLCVEQLRADKAALDSLYEIERLLR